MNPVIIFTIIYLAMIAMSFWAAYSEGRNAWDRGKFGWRIQITKKLCLPAYEFYIFVVMWPLLLLLPFVVYGWNSKLFGILVSAYFSGMVLEDFMWFVINPEVKLSEFNSKYADYYPWLKFWKFEIPWGYVISIIISIASWYFLWK
jgi:hypothetical protein